MWEFMTYPLQVVTTNRILGTALSKEAQESAQKEVIALFNRGQWQRGLYRGFGTYLGIMGFHKLQYATDNPIQALAATICLNPFLVLNVRRQASTDPYATYGSILKANKKAGGNIFKFLTLGIVPTTIGTSLLFNSILPQTLGFDSDALDILFAVGGVVLSHPFEVARIKMQHESFEHKELFGGMRKVMVAQYYNEGIGGLFRGLGPRACVLVPIMVAISQGHTFDRFTPEHIKEMEKIEAHQPRYSFE